MLILKRNPDARYTESYNVLFEGGMLAASTRPFLSHRAKRRGSGASNFTSGRAAMGLSQYGNVATLEAAKRAFRAAWDRRPNARGKS